MRPCALDESRLSNGRVRVIQSMKEFVGQCPVALRGALGPNKLTDTCKLTPDEKSNMCISTLCVIVMLCYMNRRQFKGEPLKINFYDRVSECLPVIYFAQLLLYPRGEG